MIPIGLDFSSSQDYCRNLFFVFAAGFLSPFLSGNVMSHFIVLCDHSPQVSVVVLYDMLIGHCARVSLLASTCLCSVELTWMWKKKNTGDRRGSAKPYDQEEVEGDEVTLA